MPCGAVCAPFAPTLSFSSQNENTMADLTQREVHLEFGENSLDYSKAITPNAIPRV